MWFNLSFTWCKSPTLQLVKTSHTITEPPLCFTVSVIQGVAALSPTLCHTQTLLSEPKILNFNLSAQRSSFHCSIVQSLCALPYWSLLILIYFINSGFLTAIMSYRPASQSLLLTVDVNTFFHNIGSVIFRAVCLLSHKLVTLMKLSSALGVVFGQPALLFLMFSHVSWCLLTA